MKYIFILLLLTVFLTGCAQNEVAIENSEEEVIKIGAIVFLTGNQASLGDEIINSFQIAKEDFEKKTGKKLELVIEDSKDDPAQAISAYQKLKLQGHRLIITTGDAVTAALIPLAEEDNIVLLSTVVASDDLSSEWMFRVWTTGSQHGEVLAYQANKLNISDVAIISLENIFSNSVISAFENDVNDNISIVSQEKYQIADNDVRTQLTRIKQANPDVLLITGFGPTYPVIFKQAKELQINATILADGSISIPYFFFSAGGYEVINDTYFVGTEFDNTNKENVALFRNRYSNLSDYEPSFTAAFGYDTLYVAASVLNQCDSSNANELRICLEEISDYNGLLGNNLSFSSDQKISVPLYIRQYTQGENRLIKKVE